MDAYAIIHYITIVIRLLSLSLILTVLYRQLKLIRLRTDPLTNRIRRKMFLYTIISMLSTFYSLAYESYLFLQQHITNERTVYILILSLVNLSLIYIIFKIYKIGKKNDSN